MFDRAGDYLFFYSTRNFRPEFSDLDFSWIYPNTTRIVAVALRSDVPSPLAPKNDEEPVDEDDVEEVEEKEEAADKKPAKTMKKKGKLPEASEG